MIHTIFISLTKGVSESSSPVHADIIVMLEEISLIRIEMFQGKGDLSEYFYIKVQ